MLTDHASLKGNVLKAERPERSIADHTLLHPIGEGAYGEVWLARSVTGAYRAVKVVNREAFQDEKPYEREFRGIQNFEPISRTHHGFVHVLQVGRNDSEGYFYYVMELADCADSEEGCSSRKSVDKDRYRPKTLRSEMERRKRFPVQECVELGVSLCEGLAHLHSRGLIHRDIKPSNIIFVESVPKLADIGLVTDLAEARSFVGTEGFVPPEGPNSPQADLYSLGKVLYEMCMGKDRKEFPEPFTALADGEDAAAIAELNAVVLKACATYPRDRYQTAEEMLAELKLLAGGKSIQQKRARQRVWAKARRASILVVAVACVVAATVYGTRKPAPATRGAPQQILGIEHPEFWRAPFMPRRFDFTAEGDRAVFVGGKGDVWIWDSKTSVDHELSVQGITGWQLGQLPRWAPDGRSFMVSASKQVGGTKEGPIMVAALFLVDANTGQARQVGPEISSPGVSRPLRDVCWLPDGSGVTFMKWEDVAGARLFDQLLTGEHKPWPDLSPFSIRSFALASYSPNGKWLALDGQERGALGGPGIHRERDVWLLAHLGSRVVPVVQRPGYDAYPNWTADGRSIYFSSGGGPLVNTWGIWKVSIDSETGIATGGPVEIFVKHGQKLLHPKVTAGGTHLSYAVIVPETQVWVSEKDSSGSKRVARGQAPRLSADGETVYFFGETPEQQGLYALNHRTGQPPKKLNGLIPLDVAQFDLSRDGARITTLASDGVSSGVFVVSTESGKSLVVQPTSELTTPMWSPDSQSIAYCLGRSVLRVSADGQQQETLATLPGGLESYSIRWSPDGKFIAFFGYPTLQDWGETNAIYVVDIKDKSVRRLTSPNEDKYKEGLVWHPDGQRLTYMYYGPEEFSAQIRMAYLDGRPTELIFDQPDHWDYEGVWSPDGQEFHFTSNMLATPRTCNANIHIYRADTHKITHAVRAGNLPSWSANGKVLVWTEGEPHRHFETIELTF